MDHLYKNTYRTKSLRLENWDYSRDGAYFVTICTFRRNCNFGKIANNQMVLLPMGIIADILWYEIKHHTKNCELGAFVVMPNHIHGILILKTTTGSTTTNIDSNTTNINVVVDPRHALDLQLLQLLQQPRTPPITEPKISQSIGKNRFQNQGKNTISSIVGSYKSAVTKHTHRLGYKFKWQRNYWEHIIRNENEYYRITEYIKNNPTKWIQDKLNGGVGNLVMEPQAIYNEEAWMI